MKPLDNSAKIILANSTGAAPVYIDPKSSAYDGLSLIAEAYADDIEALCGVRPEIAQTEPTSGTYVIAGVVDDELIASMNLNWSISPSNGDFKSEQWERYEIKVVEDGGKTKIVIAGSDKRGAIYGLFHITQDIFGVSPWIWWADIKPAHKDELVCTAAELETVSKASVGKLPGILCGTTRTPA